MTVDDIGTMARVALSADECRLLAKALETLDQSEGANDEALSEKLWTMAALFLSTAALVDTENNLRPGEAEETFHAALTKSGLLPGSSL